MKKTLDVILICAFLLALVLCFNGCNLDEIPEELIPAIPDEIKNLHEHPWDDWCMVYDESNISLICNVCDANVKTQPFSKGLEIRDGVLCGIGTCTDTELIVPYGVTSIADNAFQGESIKGVLLPDTVKHIGNDSFKGCESLVVFHFPNGLETIGENAFQNCKDLVAIVLPNSIKSVGAHSFENCHILGSIYYYGVEEDWNKVEKGKDWNKGAGKHAVIYKGVIIGTDEIPDIKDEAEGSQNLEFRLNSDGQSYSVLGIGTCTDADIIIPGEYKDLPVTGIAAPAFSNCTSITSVIIPDSIISVEDGAFWGCNALKFNEYDNAYYLGNHNNPYLILFKAKSTDIVSCDIPKTTRFIGAMAFSNCASLTSVAIPEGVTSIGLGAFRGCSSLAQITIPNSLTRLGDYYIYECFALTYNEYGNLRYLGNDNNPYLCLAGTKHSYITSCDIHEDTKIIGQAAFGLSNSLTIISIPDSVTSIGDQAFNHSPSLTNIIIGSGVTTIGKNAFVGCSSLTSIEVSEKNESYKSIDGNLYSKDGTELIQYSVNKTDTSFTLPGTVTSITAGAFSGSKVLENVIIPEGIVTIDKSTFSNCKSLTAVNIPASVTSIDEQAFGYCYSLQVINFDGTTEQWNAINKVSYWNMNTGNYTIHCTDGTIAKDGTITYHE